MVFIEICSLRTTKPQYEYDVRVDRQSVLGNPFKMDNESQRNAVCDEYAVYFDGIVTNNWSVLHNYCVSSDEREEFMTELRRLYKLAKKHGKLRLFCWCAPKRCHAETIKRFLWKHLEPDPTYDCDQ